MTVMTEINVFHPNSRKRDVTIESLVPARAIDALAERLGTEASEKATKTLRMMKREGIDLLQFRLGDRRVRIKQRAN